VYEHLKSSTKYTIPEDWPYADARQLFLQPDVRSSEDPECDFKWEAPDVDGLIKFLVEEKHFSEDRVRNGAAKLQRHLKTAQQSRLEGFFKPLEKTAEQKNSLKRKAEEKLLRRRSRRNRNPGVVHREYLCVCRRKVHGEMYRCGSISDDGWGFTALGGFSTAHMHDGGLLTASLAIYYQVVEVH
jgi:hypothetical protein